MARSLVLLFTILFRSQSLTTDASVDLILVEQPSGDLLGAIVRAHYRNPETYVKIEVQNGNSSTASRFQESLMSELVFHNSGWMVVASADLPRKEERPAYYSVLLLRDYESLVLLAAGMSHQTHHYHGLYTIFIEQCSDACLAAAMGTLWNQMILNVAVISKTHEGQYLAHSYHPYEESKCGIVTPVEIGRYVDGTWTDLVNWFPQKTTNFHGCPLAAGVFDFQPFSMHRLEGNRTVHKGIEVTIVSTMAQKLNFSISYRQPEGNVKWGMLLPTNSTGLVGMILRREVDFGFSCLGINPSRIHYLRLGPACHYGQLRMAIPPKQPYTSFEKLFQPFSLQSWLCVVCCYAIVSIIALAIFNLRQAPEGERLPNSFYTLWVLLMGGPCNPLRRDSSRLFIIAFVLNTLVVRTLYHGGMFEKLQESDSLASELNTFNEINRAGMVYYMYNSSTLYYKDNPLVDPGRIRFIQDTSTDLERLLYALSHHKLDGVITLPLDCIKYYIKMNAQRGLVYVAKSTGLNYNTGIFFPKTSSLQESFNSLMLRLHEAGLPNYWSQEFEDNRYWLNAKKAPEPSSLQWGHISGAFRLCGLLHLVSVVILFAEIGWSRFGPKLLSCLGKLNSN